MEEHRNTITDAASATPYEVLGVLATASAEELRRAYRVALRTTHPDVGGSAERFRAVQAAWRLVGDEQSRRAYDSGLGFATERAASRESGGAEGLRARSFGFPAGEGYFRYTSWMLRWAETEEGNLLARRLGYELTEESVYESQVIRSAPLRARRLFASAQAAEGTAQVLSALGMGFTVWHDVAAGSGVIDHVVLGPSGIFAMDSRDWGSEVRLVRDELRGEGLDDNERVVASLAKNTRRLARELGITFTAVVVVVPDSALPGVAAEATRGLNPAGVVVRKSVLPQLMREGLGGVERTGLSRLYEYRARLRQGIRHTQR
ncbi:DnaJ domain-containing protein [Lysinibacter sp. HNR]|uniref:J domain-containing protein n=1 Tax=Lysinibacter sp. HNR TaxID=3031408 RepID=UPI00243514F6|nr:DnaJ domain-containing protein [Lysinibacter sp. HNR]WGD36925.1 DnaJ domain-containing protein [Lysinibacter sp. HNR]